MGASWVILKILVTYSILFMFTTAASSAYIHIPFCRRRCFYCDFPIQVVGERQSTRTSESEQYVDLLLRDISLISRRDVSKEQGLTTIYFGGGTPSLLPVACFERILNKLQNSFGINNDCEITIEADPGTFDLIYLQQLKRMGCNRLSIGVQSFDDAMLEACGRAHRNVDTVTAIENIHNAGFDNFSIDLISSLPSMTLEMWHNTLVQAKSVGSSHISVYDLQVEEKTAFGRWYSPGVFPLPSQEKSAQMYRLTVETLCKSPAAFEHYEVSNYARLDPSSSSATPVSTSNVRTALSRWRSRHNQKYWKCEPVMGFGMGAAAFVDGLRTVRPSRMADYLNWVQTAEAEAESELGLELKRGTSVVAAVGYTSQGSQHRHHQQDVVGERGGDILDVVMLSLRTADGLDLHQLEKEFVSSGGIEASRKILGCLEPFAARGLVCISDDRSFVRLTDPEGFLLSNDVISSVFASLSD